MKNHEPIEKLLAQVQLRQPELDVEAMLGKAAELGALKSSELVDRKRPKRCFRYWATMTGVWSSGLVVGILVTYLCTSSSLKTAQAELQLAQSQLAAQAEQPEEPTNEPLTETKYLCQSDEQAWKKIERSASDRFFERLSQPGSFDRDEPLYAMGYISPRKHVKHAAPSSKSFDTQGEEPTTESEPYVPKPAKTQQQLFKELLRELNV